MDRQKSKHAIGECARSGQKMLLKDMVEDGYYPGTWVHPDWYDGPHPQESLPDIFEDPSINNPSPPNNQENTIIRWPCFDINSLSNIPPANATFFVGDVEVILS